MCIYGNVQLGSLNTPKGMWAVPFLHIIEIKTTGALELSNRATQSKKRHSNMPPFIAAYRSSPLHVQKGLRRLHHGAKGKWMMDLCFGC